MNKSKRKRSYIAYIILFIDNLSKVCDSASLATNWDNSSRNFAGLNQGAVVRKLESSNVAFRKVESGNVAFRKVESVNSRIFSGLVIKIHGNGKVPEKSK